MTSKFIKIFLLCLLSFYLWTYFNINYNISNISSNNTKNQKTPIVWNLFYETYNILKNKYVNPTIFKDTKPFEYGTIKWLISWLDDPFSSFMTPEENKEFTESLQWNFQWIWAELTVKHWAIIVVTPLKNSPAKKSWLMPEDIILKVDDVEIEWEPLIDVVKKIRWKKWTNVVLNIFRPKTMETLDITITRDVIILESVESKMIWDTAFI